ncbi:MAG: tetratricopeptide repeat protein [Planctomycetes bacterium]|nr:tetratricopeptide repeat protein [Planctomycetota bacterium]
MAQTKNADSEPAPDPNARVVTTTEDRAKAHKWFVRARELGDKRQFDYAIEYYVNGLEFWPDAVEEACKPLHGCAVARHQTGGKKPGFKDSMKRSMNDKDVKRAFLNAAWLFGHDPDNIDYMIGLARNASRLRAEHCALWAAGISLRAVESSAKSGPKQFRPLAKLFEEIGDRATARDDVAFGVESYQMGVNALNALRQRVPKDRETENGLRDMSTKLTILRGKYQDGGSFRDSIEDIDAQTDLHDEKLSVQADDRLDQLIAKAEATYRENPDDQAALARVVDLLTRREQEQDELRAIGILVAQYKSTSEYRHKHLADDIRMKQLGRNARQAAKAGDEDAAKEAQLVSLRFDLSVFKERVERYPTDNRVKFEYGVRLIRAGRYDDAIPLLQAARTDPKNRTACGMHLGRCFFKKGYYDQAIPTLEHELAEYQFSDDELAKTMLYWLGRSQEAGGQIDAARETYGKILQADYNFKDVRVKLDNLPAHG